MVFCGREDIGLDVICTLEDVLEQPIALVTMHLYVPVLVAMKDADVAPGMSVLLRCHFQDVILLPLMLTGVALPLQSE